MPPKEQVQNPIPVSAPKTEEILTHHLVNADENAKRTHELLQHHLIKGDENASASHSLGRNAIELQGREVAALESIDGKLGKDTVVIKKVELPPDGTFVFRGDKGEKGDTGERGEKGERGNDAAAEKVDYPKIWEYVMQKVDALVPSVVEKVLAFIKKGKRISYADLADAPEFPKMAGTGYLREISDVSIQNIAVGQSIQWDGKKWVPFTPTVGSNQVFGENVALSGSGTAFKLAHAPISGTVRLYRGGAYQNPSNTYSIDASGNITLLAAGGGALQSGEELFADYNY